MFFAFRDTELEQDKLGKLAKRENASKESVGLKIGRSA
jgi:hypothetical protein